mmetsp:Transcript_125206/g.245467  ORF Transcript_125206/g.245467 Transcript_125206/m.245467 type:complete len:216 (+) Transcript_125206:136-783(+)
MHAPYQYKSACDVLDGKVASNESERPGGNTHGFNWVGSRQPWRGHKVHFVDPGPGGAAHKPRVADDVLPVPPQPRPRWPVARSGTPMPPMPLVPTAVGSTALAEATPMPCQSPYVLRTGDNARFATGLGNDTARWWDTMTCSGRWPEYGAPETGVAKGAGGNGCAASSCKPSRPAAGDGERHRAHALAPAIAVATISAAPDGGGGHSCALTPLRS